MTNKSFAFGDYIYLKTGDKASKFREDGNNKYFAVIARCGHSGEGYFIPIMFAVYAKDLNSAIELTKTYARVRTHKKDAIIDAFEISEKEANFINIVNEVDPFLNGYATEEDKITESRKVAHEPKTDYELRAYRDLEQKIIYNIKTADQYFNDFVLERYLAPIKDGDRYIYPKTINRKALMRDYFNEKTYRLGIIKSRAHFLAYYYEIFGIDNDLNIILDPIYQTFVCPLKNGKIANIPIPDNIYKYLIESGCLEFKSTKNKPKETPSSENYKLKAVPTGLERFKKKYPNLAVHKQPGSEDC